MYCGSRSSLVNYFIFTHFLCMSMQVHTLAGLSQASHHQYDFIILFLVVLIFFVSFLFFILFFILFLIPFRVVLFEFSFNNFFPCVFVNRDYDCDYAVHTVENHINTNSEKVHNSPPFSKVSISIN